MAEETILGAIPLRPPFCPPVYWPRKVTRPVLRIPLVLSRAAWGLSVVVLPFGEDSRGEGGSDSEPGVERGASEGAGRGAHAAHPDPPSVMTADTLGPLPWCSALVWTLPTVSCTPQQPQEADAIIPAPLAVPSIARNR